MFALSERIRPSEKSRGHRGMPERQSPCSRSDDSKLNEVVRFPGSVFWIRPSLRKDPSVAAASCRIRNGYALYCASLRGASATYQFPALDSVIIPCALMVRFRCIRGTRIVHATRNLGIPRSGRRFDLWNPALRPRIVGFGGAFGRPAAGRQRAERRVRCVILIGPQRYSECFQAGRRHAAIFA